MGAGLLLKQISGFHKGTVCAYFPEKAGLLQEEVSFPQTRKMMNLGNEVLCFTKT